eukprot:363259-Chlamydomonas_euryale.AAC.10
MYLPPPARALLTRQATVSTHAPRRRRRSRGRRPRRCDGCVGSRRRRAAAGRRAVAPHVPCARHRRSSCRGFRVAPQAQRACPPPSPIPPGTPVAWMFRPGHGAHPYSPRAVCRSRT